MEVDFGRLTGALKGGGMLESRWILTRLGATCGAVEKALEAYRFDEAASAVYQFFWGDLCDWYLEVVKLRLDFGPEADTAETTAAMTTLVAVFEAALRLLSPFMPFITEEIWHALWAHSASGVAPAKSIALTRFPLAGDVACDEVSAKGMELLQEVIVTVRGLRKELGVPEKEATPMRIYGSGGSGAAEIASEHAKILAKMARVNAVEWVGAALSGNGTRSAPAFDVQVVYERVIDVPAERERLTKELARFEKGLAAANKQLGNEGFMGRAPAHIVEGLKKQAAETQALFDKATAALAELGVTS